MADVRAVRERSRPSKKENECTIIEGFAALDRFNTDQRRQGREIIDQLEAESGIGIVLLARPYHNDPGACHEILAEFQKRGYPALMQDSLQIDEDIL